MSPLELKEKLNQGEDILILDVREPEEWAYANIGGVHLPLGDLSRRFSELDPDKETYVLCHHGMRSAQAVGFLRQQGFSKVFNIAGGIEAWSCQVDRNIKRY